MPKKWTAKEAKYYKKELLDLYVKKNLTIGQIGKELGISEKTVFKRLRRFNLKTLKHLKPGFTNARILNNTKETKELAEFVGIMLGDGHISEGQVKITLGNKEQDFVNYIISLFKKLFDCELKTFKTNKGYTVLYIGFIKLVRYLRNMGLRNNKVREQVGVPKWILGKEEYKTNFLRGFFDTDGSVYKLRHGWQISYCNRSFSLLNGTRDILLSLDYHPSAISGYNIYLTRRTDLNRFVNQIGSNNLKKKIIFQKIINGQVQK